MTKYCSECVNRFTPDGELPCSECCKDEENKPMFKQRETETIQREVKSMIVEFVNKGCETCRFEHLPEDDVFCQPCCDGVEERWQPAEPDQSAKADAGKPRLTKVPRQIIWDIASVREYGWEKYGEGADRWAEVEIQRYRDAAFRHFMAYLENPKGVDSESQLSHLAHLATNIAFLCEMEKGE